VAVVMLGRRRRRRRRKDFKDKVMKSVVKEMAEFQNRRRKKVLNLGKGQRISCRKEKQSPEFWVSDRSIHRT
jgi:hypothetical protein